MRHVLQVLVVVALMVTCMTKLTVVSASNYQERSGKCYKTKSVCLRNSAEGTRTKWHACSTRCLCLGFRYGKCEKSIGGTSCYSCMCIGSRSVSVNFQKISSWCGSLASIHQLPPRWLYQYYNSKFA